MADDIYEDAISQYIDISGKTRVIHYQWEDTIISLVMFPMPPLDLPEDKVVKEADLEKVLSFMKSKQFIINTQDGNLETNEIKGLWISPKIDTLGVIPRYIPIKKTTGIKNVEYSALQPPINLEARSYLKLFRNGKKAAEYLKQYVLYTYALDPTNFDEGSIVVDPSHTYDLEKLNKKLYMEDENNINQIMYDSKRRLIVTSDIIKAKLLDFVKVSLLNDTSKVLALAQKRGNIENYYNSVYDFKNYEGQIIFTDKSDILEWKRESSTLRLTKTISNTFLYDVSIPYYYRNPKIRHNEILLIQNVDGGVLEKALTVSHKWREDQINLGYDPDIFEDVTSSQYTIYSLENPDESHKGKGKELSVINYYEDQYAAILIL